MLPVNAHNAEVVAADPFPVIPPVQVSPATEGPKRYLRDFPDSAKTYVPERKRTQIKDDFGNILEVEDLLKDRIVLEDPSEPRLLKLARVAALMNHSDPKYVGLLRSMGTEFPQEDVNTAIQAVYDEISALHPPAVREAAARFVQYVMVDRHNPDWVARQANPPIRETTPWGIFCSFGDDISYLYSIVERNYPMAVRGVKVAAVAALIFFLYVYGALRLYHNHRNHNPL